MRVHLAIAPPDICEGNVGQERSGPAGVSPSHGSPESIVDAKWKILKPSRLDWGVDEDDARQVLAYLLRYGCRRVRLAYAILSGARFPIVDPPTF